MTKLIAEGKERLDRFIARKMPDQSRTRLVKMIETGEVLVDGNPRKPSFELRAGMRVEIAEIAPTPPHDLTPVPIPLQVLFEDESLLVVNKPRGMASHPSISQKSPTLVHALLARSHELSTAAGAYRPGIVHRLDKDTTGLMIVAKTDHAHRALAGQIQAKSAERRYVAIIKGELDRPKLRVEAPIARDPSNRLRMRVDPNGRYAATEFKALQRLDVGQLIAAKLETGRTHQIRVHLMAIGHPVKGDSLYAPGDWKKGALQLHAVYISFDHPLGGNRIELFAKPPNDFLGHELVREDDIANW